MLVLRYSDFGLLSDFDHQISDFQPVVIPSTENSE